MNKKTIKIIALVVAAIFLVSVASSIALAFIA